MAIRHKTRVVRVDENFALLRKNHINNLRAALNGLNIHELDLDKFYTKKLSNINILEEFFKTRKR